jgi:hypothetical protein
MKHSIMLYAWLAVGAVASPAPAVIAYPFYSITFYRNGAPPAQTLIRLNVTDEIYVGLADSVGGQNVTIKKLEIRGDSLLLYPETLLTVPPLYNSFPVNDVMPVPMNGPNIIFNRSGRYQAYQSLFAVGYPDLYLGEFRILPKISTCPAMPVPSASVKAAAYEPCAGLLYSATSPETFRTVTDNQGNFTLELPRKHLNYYISIEKAGYHPQTLYHWAADSSPDQISFELIPAGEEAVAGLEVLVTKNGIPVESAYVFIHAGPEMIACALVQTAKSAVTANASQRTTAEGRAAFTGLSLSPSIDYTFSVSKYSLESKSDYQSGVIRLNKYGVNVLAIDFSPVANEAWNPVPVTAGLRASPNPFNPSTVLQFPNPGRNATVLIYDLNGKMVANFGTVKENRVVWTGAGFSSGIYLVKAKTNGRQFTKKLLLSR